MKQCNACPNIKPFDDFYEHPGSKDGYLNKCKSCVGDQMTLYRQNNIEKVREQGRVNSQTHRDNHPDESIKEQNK